MLFIFSTPVLIRHQCQLKTVIFLHWCLMCAVPLVISQWASTVGGNQPIVTSVFSLQTSVFTLPHGTMLTAYGCLYMDVRRC